MTGKRALLICGNSQTVVTFRSGLIKALQEAGYTVFAVGFGKEYEREIAELGVEYYAVTDENRSLNPVRLLSLKDKYYKVIKRVNPYMVCTFQLKPNVFGLAAARKAGIKNTCATVEGVGDVFIRNTPKWRLLRRIVCALYKRALRAARKVFFLNGEDKTEFLRRRLVKGGQCEIVQGVGVDLEKFSYRPVQDNRAFLMTARMYKTKGVLEYCRAARLVKRRYPAAKFRYIGGEGELKRKDLQEYVADGSVEYLGTMKDVRAQLTECGVFVLPSYREGLPVSVLEAEATGRAILAGDVVGCKDAVEEGENGFLTKAGDSEALAEKMIWFLEHSQAVEQMGKNSRKIAESRFDTRRISGRFVRILEEAWRENA